MEGYNVVEENNSGMWKRIWNLKIPPKVNHFIWRLCHDCLPTRLNLIRRNFSVDCCCALCNEELETGWHVFMVCRFGLNCWKEAGLSNSVDEWIDKAESMKDVINFCSSYLDCWTAAKFCMILWSLWRERNNEVWNKSHASLSALCVLSDWCAANNVKMPSAASVDNNILNGVKWNKPTFPFFKCNVDALLSTITFSTGIGMVIRDDNGEFVVARIVRFPGVFSVREAEAMRVREALSWIKNLGFRKVILETDAKYIVEGIESVEFGDSEYDSILKKCQLMLQGEPTISVAFVRRSGNKVAHVLAKEAHSFDSPSVWSFPPRCIITSIIDDI